MKLQKETKIAERLHGRWYNDACGTAFGLELLGERWALLIVRELMFGPRRFSDLRAGLPGISAKSLTERLDGLERAGVVERAQLAPPAALRVYRLTALGEAAEPVIAALGRWAASAPGHDITLPLSAASLMMSLRTMFDARAAECASLVAAIEIGPDSFRLEVTDAGIAITRGEAVDAALRLTVAEAPVLAALIYGGVPAAELEQAGQLTIAGDRALIAILTGLFCLPDKFG